MNPRPFATLFVLVAVVLAAILAIPACGPAAVDTTVEVHVTSPGATTGPPTKETFSATETSVAVATSSDESPKVYSVIYREEIEDAIDIVFVPDDDYGDMDVVANRQAFLDDVATMIYEGFFQNNVFYKNAYSINFWYMTVSGDAAEPAAGKTCPTVTWPDLDTAVFADEIVLLHRNDLRDCAWGNKVTSEPTSNRAVVHESGHGVFSLPDEYCCDGGYWVHPPILFDNEEDCVQQVGSVDISGLECQSFDASDGKTWWRSEDNIEDIMCTSGEVVLEFGPMDWVAVEKVLKKQLSNGYEAADVFAPTDFNW